MYYRRYSLLAFSLWLTVGSLSAQTNSYIWVGKYKAHPTRIIAKYKDPNNATVQSTAGALSAFGVSVEHRFGLVPGLVLLDSKASVALQSVQALNPQAQADA